MPTSDVDAFGNYQPHPTPNPTQSGGFGMVLNGTGAPSAASGNNGDTYIDLVNGDIYRKFGGAWTIFSGGSGATELFFIGTPAQDPNGVVTATRPAIAYDANGAIWIKTGAGATNTGWIAVIT